MKSPRGFAAAVVLLLAIPMTVLYQRIAGSGEAVVIHAALGLGAALMSFAVFDFRTPGWVNRVGCAAAGALAAIFLLQGLSELMPQASLDYVVYQVLGQRVEGWLVDVFLLWCVAVLLLDSHGPTRVVGIVALATAGCVEAYAMGLARAGTSLDAEAPGLKVFMLLPFVWLLVESRKPSR